MAAGDDLADFVPEALEGGGARQSASHSVVAKDGITGRMFASVAARVNRLTSAGHDRVCLAALFLVGMLHRLLQLWLLWPTLAKEIKLVAGNQAMQLLPADILRHHLGWGLWYLQGAPPLPNLLFAFLVRLTTSPYVIAASCILFCGALSATAACLLATLLRRFDIPSWICFLAAALLLFAPDIIVLEYNTMGQFYYEFITMCLCLLACHASLDVLRGQGAWPACQLGLCVALLALTRSSFSFLWPVVLLWLATICAGRQPRVVAAFLAPVLVLQGGWSLKNELAHGNWSWSTSSWGGASLNKSEIARNGRAEFEHFLAAHPPICASPWDQLTRTEPPYFFLWPAKWPPTIALPTATAREDQESTARRGEYVVYDSASGSVWSRCLFREFARYWASRPILLVTEALQSYRIFWAPIRQFTVMFGNPLQPDLPAYTDGFDIAHSLAESWQEWHLGYRLALRPISLAPMKPSDFVPVTVIALPVLPSLIATVNLPILHSLPLLMAWRWWRKIQRRLPDGFGFLWLLYCYLAAVSSIVEFGENMRFRLDVEPLIWALCLLSLQAFWTACAGPVREPK